ncbi:MAG: Melanoma-associated antigen [Marteilia pararefringens]
MDDDSKEHFANLIVRFLLIRRNKNIIKRQTLLKLIDSSYTKLDLESIFSDVNDKLNNIFGLKLVKIEGSIPSYAFVDMKPLPDYTKYTDLDTERCMFGALEMTFLAFILLNGKSATEKEMNRFLSLLGFEGGYKHPVFGDCAQVLSYLLKSKIIASVKDIRKSQEYVWGKYAEQITTEKEVYDYCSKIYGIEPSIFKL